MTSETQKLIRDLKNIAKDPGRQWVESFVEETLLNAVNLIEEREQQEYSERLDKIAEKLKGDDFVRGVMIGEIDKSKARLDALEGDKNRAGSVLTFFRLHEYSERLDVLESATLITSNNAERIKAGVAPVPGPDEPVRTGVGGDCPGCSEWNEASSTQLMGIKITVAMCDNCGKVYGRKTPHDKPDRIEYDPEWPVLVRDKLCADGCNCDMCRLAVFLKQEHGET